MATEGDETDPEIKLPSNKLQVSVPFTVTEGEELDFVFDITVIKTGNGMYILKPRLPKPVLAKILMRLSPRMAEKKMTNSLLQSKAMSSLVPP